MTDSWKMGPETVVVEPAAKQRVEQQLEVVSLALVASPKSRVSGMYRYPGLLAR
jgi:hypothetical protein